MEERGHSQKEEVSTPSEGGGEFTVGGGECTVRWRR